VALLFIFLLFRLRTSYIVNKKNTELGLLNQKLAVANETLKSLSVTDGLTGAYNHRYFKNHIQEQLELAKRNHNTYMSLLMIDVDEFKSINDRFGHVIGDKLLQEISKTIQKALPRSTDVVARYGGDEFVVALYDTKIHGALIVGQRIRRDIEQCKISLDAVFEDDTSSLVGTTVSIGIISILPTVTTSSESIITLADEALYIAKEEGKNKIVIHQNSDRQNDANLS
jgi:diguanylate cyclase (GGDEF)-like protein